MTTISLKSSGGAGRVKRDGGDYGAGLIEGVSLVTRGEALGHGYWLDDVFLAQVTRAALLAKSDGLKARFAHPPFLSDSIGSVLGRFKHPHRSADGTRVLADLHLLKAAHDSPQGNLADYVLNLATEDPELFAASIVYEPDTGAERAFMAEHTTGGRFKSPDRENAGNYPHARLAKLHGADLVDEPAANPGGLFAATYSNEGAIALSSKGNDMMMAALSRDSATALNKSLGGHVKQRFAVGSDEHGTFTNPHGGFTLPTTLADEFKRSMFTTGALLSRVSRVEIPGTPRGAVQIPVIDETSRADGQRWGGIEASWESETGESQLSRPRFGRAELHPYRLTASVPMTNEVVKYAGTLLGNILREALESELRFQVERCILGGAGAAGRPLGVLDSPSLITVPGESMQPAGIVDANIRKMLTRLHPESRNRAIWLCSNDLTDALVDLGRDYITYAPSMRLLGIPIVFSEHCRAVGALGDILLCDLSQYVVYDDTLELIVSDHVRFNTDQKVIRASWRLDGQPLWRSPITPLHGSQSVSPFVTLAARGE